MGKYCLASILLLSFHCYAPPSNEPDPTEKRETATNTQLPYAPLDKVIGLDEKWQGDLDSMIARRRIRALVPYSRMHYYIDGTERSGLSFDAMQAFENFLNKQINSPHRVHIVFIPTTRDQLLSRLREGYGDLVATGLTITPERRQEVLFSDPIFKNSEEVIVSGPSSPLREDNTALSRTPIYVRQSSSYYEHLMEINDSLETANLPLLDIRLLEEQLEDEQVLAMINEGLLSATLIERNLANFWAQTMDNLSIHQEYTLFKGGAVAYALREENPQLASLLNQFIQKHKKGTLIGNMLYKRYLQDTTYLKQAYGQNIRQRILHTRDLFMKYGQEYDLDWLILAALGYQESRLQQSATSHAGAVGIMQIRPTTAMDPNIAVADVYQLENNIHAGTKYLRFLIDNYFVHPEIDSLNAGLFALAAYNAGPFRVMKFREAAARQGFDKNVWFNNVEIIAAQQIGRETVQYVSNIFKFYTSYRALFRYTQETGVSIFHEGPVLRGVPKEES
ncbi:MAG: lytic transglycosylase F [Chitinophagales bacterium]|nr:lytic transglycosylase F [Chitinophagales bacterium]